MPDRGWIFLFSLLSVIGALSICAWLIVSGQATSFDGLFLLLASGVAALSFSLYLFYLIRREIRRISQAQPPAPARAAAASKSPETSKPPADKALVH
jgi:hypothetical protein